MIFVSTVKVPHSAKTPGRETFHIRVLLVQIFGCHNSGTLFRSPAYSLADLAVQFHLRKLHGHQHIESFIHFTVVNILILESTF